jgi:thioredoxin 1
MNPVDLSEATFERTIARSGIVLVDFWAPWCGPCLAFDLVFEAAALANPDIVFGKVNTQTEPHLAESSDIASIPTLMAFRYGMLVFEEVGALSASGLREVIEVVRGLDPEAVTTEAVKADAAHGEPLPQD